MDVKSSIPSITPTSSTCAREEHRASMTPECLFTVDQLAEALQISKATVYGYVRQGRIPAIRVGKHVRFDFRDVLMVLKSDSKNTACASEGRRLYGEASVRSLTGEKRIMSGSDERS